MLTKTIVYFHGFGSSGQSRTVKHLRMIMPEYKVLAPDIPVNPAEALPFLKNYCRENKPDLVIGTSMGGMYATRYAIGDYKIEPAEYVGIVKEVHPFLSGNYMYSIICCPVHWICLVLEDSIIEKLPAEQSVNDGKKDLPSSR